MAKSALQWISCSTICARASLATCRACLVGYQIELPASGELGIAASSWMETWYSCPLALNLKFATSGKMSTCRRPYVMLMINHIGLGPRGVLEPRASNAHIPRNMDSKFKNVVMLMKKGTYGWSCILNHKECTWWAEVMNEGIQSSPPLYISLLSDQGSKGCALIRV